MATDKNQSSIREARDQLFVDTADGVRLNTVTYNLGLIRPRSGITDDEWRTIAKKIALTSKQILPPFKRILEVTTGPQYARAGDLTTAVAVGDEIITVADASAFVQVGSIVLDRGLTTEETIAYCYTDTVNNQIYLTTAATKVHGVLASGSGNLRNDVAVNATTVVLIDSSGLPTTYPYPILIGKGTLLEEVVVVTNNDTGTNTLTVSAPAGASYTGTQYAHTGTQSGFVRRPLEVAAPLGRDFLQFDIDDTSVFPSSGWVFVDQGETEEELLEFTSNNGTLHYLELKKPVAYLTGHAAAASVTLAVLGESVETASVLQEGAHWDINDASPRELKVIIPTAEATESRLTDASFLHDVAVTPAASTTTSSAVSVDDTEIPLTSTTGFPEAGVVQIDSSYYTGYVLDAANTQILVSFPLTSAFGGGVSVDVIEDPYAATDLEEGSIRDTGGILEANRYSGPYILAPTEKAPSRISSTITTALPFPTRVISNQDSGFTTLEVADASTWPSVGYPINARIGFGTARNETVQALGRYLQSAISTSVSVGHSAEDTILLVADGQFFPDTNVTNRAGYRIIIDPGGLNEVVTVLENDGLTGPGTFTLSGTGLSQPLVGGETVELVSDVLTFDPFSFAHNAATVDPSVLGDLVEPYISEIALVSVADFPTTGGTILINFGLEELSGGVFEEVEYQDVDALKLVFNPAIPLSSGHIVGERVTLSIQASIAASDGTTYPFLMPPDPTAGIVSLFDLVRAAGVKVTVLNSR